MKYVLIIPDGMGDQPLDELGGRTPLEAAHTPNLDFFSRHGLVGTSAHIPKGFNPGTDIGCMSVFGYDPAKYFTGRGPLEAAELGIRLGPEELAFRCNLVTIEGTMLKDFSADHISTQEAAELVRFFDQHVRQKTNERFHFYPGEGTGYRNLMVCRDETHDLAKVTCTPPHDIMGQSYGKFLPKGKGADTLIDLMETSKKIFQDHPVNKKRLREGKGPASMIWLWGQGFPPSLPSYFERYGLYGGVITAVDLLKGIAIYAGLDVIRVPGVTGYFDTNYSGKAEYAINALRSRDFMAIHVESTDEAGHIGDAKLKIRAIEDLDRLVVGTLREGLKEFGEFKMMVTPDHYTCVRTRTHAPDPVPFLIYSSKETHAGPKKFCEKTAAVSRTVFSEGHRLMDFFIKGQLS